MNIPFDEFLDNALDGAYSREEVVKTLYENIDTIIDGIDEKNIELHDEENDNIGYMFVFFYDAYISNMENLKKIIKLTSYVDINTVKDGSIIVSFVFYGMNDGR